MQLKAPLKLLRGFFCLVTPMSAEPPGPVWRFNGAVGPGTSILGTPSPPPRLRRTPGPLHSSPGMNSTPARSSSAEDFVREVMTTSPIRQASFYP
jgi:hypothetical protein